MEYGRPYNRPTSHPHSLLLIPLKILTLRGCTHFDTHLTVLPSPLPPSLNLQAYSYRTGTSQAAPFVAGAVACVLGDALAAGGPVACRSSSTLLQSLLNPDVEVKQRAKGSRSFSDTRRPMLYVPPGAEYNLDCPLPAGLVAAMAATVGKGA